MRRITACAALGGGRTGGTPPPDGVPSPVTTTRHGAWDGDAGIDQPPPFEVRWDDRSLVLFAHTFCHRSGCADGFDDDPPSAGSPGTLFVRVPVEGLTELTVSQHPAEDDPWEGSAAEASVRPLGDGWWAVTPRGPAGEYRVSLFAVGDGAGDMIADLLWTSPDDVPSPTALRPSAPLVPQPRVQAR